MSMKKEEAEKYLKGIKPEYCVVGFKSDGVRGIPPTYMMQCIAVPQENIFEALRGFEGVRVFTLAEDGESADWLHKRNKYFAEKTVEEEKKLLAELKEKYPDA